MYSQMVEEIMQGIITIILVLFGTCLVFVPLGIWKLIELIF